MNSWPVNFHLKPSKFIGVQALEKSSSITPVLGLLVVFLFLSRGFPHGHDASYELFRVAEFRNAILSGQWPPYWAENLFLGFGSPIYLFYAPLYCLVSTAFSGFFDSVVDGSTVTIGFFLVISLYGMRRSAQLIIKGTQDEVYQASVRVASTCYILNPYLLGNAFLRNANAEYVALCLFPLAIYGLLLAGQNSYRKSLLVLSAALSLSILAHNLTALVTMTFVIGSAFSVYLPQKNLRALMAIFAAIILSLILSAFFWIPAIAYNDLTRTTIELQKGKLYFENNFVPIHTLFSYQHFYSSGLVPILSFLGGVVSIYYFLKRNRLKVAWWVALVLFSVTLLILQLRATTIIWKHVPFLALVQFPWRFMGPFGAVSALFAAFLFTILGDLVNKRFLWILEWSIFCTILLNALPNLQKSQPLAFDIKNALHQSFKADQIRINPGAMATFRWEYIPIYANKYIWKKDHPAQGPFFRPIPNANLSVLKDSSTEIVFVSRHPNQTRAIIRRWFFPGWRVRINGHDKKVKMSTQGLVVVEMPAGVSRVHLFLPPPPVRELSNIISLFGVCIWLLILAFFRYPLGIKSSQPKQALTNLKERG